MDISKSGSFTQICKKNSKSEYQVQIDHLSQNLNPLSSINFTKLSNTKENNKRWSKQEIIKWFAFIIRFSIDFPYSNIESQLKKNSEGDIFYEKMQKACQTRSKRQCKLFSKRISRKIKMSHKDENIIEFVIRKYKSFHQNSNLLKQYEMKFNQKSQYLASIIQFNKFLDSEKNYLASNPL